MTYWQFLLLFLVVPILCLSIVIRHVVTFKLLAVLCGISLVAIVYTAPWDSAIIANGVWSYRSPHVLGLVIARVPLEEYGFYVLQTFLVGLMTALIANRRKS